MQLVRCHYLDRLENEIYKPISDLHDSTHGSFSFCPRAERKVTRYTMGLCGMKNGVCKLSETLLTLEMAWTGLSILASNIAEIEKSACTGCKKLCTVPMASPIDLAVAIESAQVVGLCLYCEKEGMAPTDCEHVRAI
jgi:hypothetical protein